MRPSAPGRGQCGSAPISAMIVVGKKLRDSLLGVQICSWQMLITVSKRDAASESIVCSYRARAHHSAVRGRDRLSSSLLLIEAGKANPLVRGQSVCSEQHVPNEVNGPPYWNRTQDSCELRLVGAARASERDTSAPEAMNSLPNMSCPQECQLQLKE